MSHLPTPHGIPSPMNAGALLLCCLSVCGIALGCGPSQEEYDAALAHGQDLESQLRDAEAARTQLDERFNALSAQNEELADRLRALGQNVEALEGERTNLQTSLAETQRALEQLRERERQAQARLSTFQNLIDRFRALREAGSLQVRIVRNHMVLALPEGVLFDSGRAELKEAGQATLGDVATILIGIAGREFQIAGHTDNIPIRTRRFRNNWMLSSARAVTVARYLIEQQLPANRLSAAGYADTQPVATNDTAEGRAQNRRIEIVLVPNLDELPDLSSLQGLTQ